MCQMNVFFFSRKQIFASRSRVTRYEAMVSSLARSCLSYAAPERAQLLSSVHGADGD